MTHINRTTENRIRKITNEYTIDTDANMYFINAYTFTESQIEEFNKFLEECEHVNESMDADIYFGYDDEYIIIDWFGADI